MANRWRGLIMVGAIVLGGGCSRSVEWLDARDRSEPLFRRARAKQHEGDVDGAAALYLEAINGDQRMARAHLDLALLLHHEKKDYLGAVCHYRRYLEMRPETEKKAMVEKRMQLAMQLLAASLAPGGERVALVDVAPGLDTRQSDAELAGALQRVKVAEESETLLRGRVAGLERDNRQLQSELHKMESELEQVRATSVIADNRADDRDRDRSEASGRQAKVDRTYKVNRGDTLSSIAGDVYGDEGRWRDILEANKDLLKNSPQIQAGQVLVVP